MTTNERGVQRLVLVLGSLALLASCAPSSPAAAPDHASGSPPGGLAELERDTGVRWHAWGKLGKDGYSGLEPETPPPPVLTLLAAPRVAALTFLERYGGAFGLVDPARELAFRSEEGGDHRSASFVQVEGGVAVESTLVDVNFDGYGSIMGVRADVVPSVRGFPVKPAITPKEAAFRAIVHLETRYRGATAVLDHGRNPTLKILARDQPATLVYLIKLSAVGSDSYPFSVEYDVDALTGAIVNFIGPNEHDP